LRVRRLLRENRRQRKRQRGRKRKGGEWRGRKVVVEARRWV